MAKRRTKKATPGELADKLLELRDKRTKLNRQIDDIKKEETRTKKLLWAWAKRHDVTKVTGAKATVGMELKPVPSVTDWPAFYRWLVRNKAPECLQRRLNAKAIAERWEAKKKVAGVEPVDVPSWSVNKATRG